MLIAPLNEQKRSHSKRQSLSIHYCFTGSVHDV